MKRKQDSSDLRSLIGSGKRNKSVVQSVEIGSRDGRPSSAKRTRNRSPVLQAQDENYHSSSNVNNLIPQINMQNPRGVSSSKQRRSSPNEEMVNFQENDYNFDHAMEEQKEQMVIREQIDQYGMQQINQSQGRNQVNGVKVPNLRIQEAKAHEMENNVRYTYLGNKESIKNKFQTVNNMNEDKSQNININISFNNAALAQESLSVQNLRPQNINDHDSINAPIQNPISGDNQQSPMANKFLRQNINDHSIQNVSTQMMVMNKLHSNLENVNKKVDRIKRIQQS